jgi:hypothetical protein
MSVCGEFQVKDRNPIERDVGELCVCEEGFRGIVNA